jgi:hypothetical protein
MSIADIASVMLTVDVRRFSHNGNTLDLAAYDVLSLYCLVVANCRVPVGADDRSKRQRERSQGRYRPFGPSLVDAAHRTPTSDATSYDRVFCRYQDSTSGWEPRVTLLQDRSGEIDLFPWRARPHHTA